jgi:uncharacterized protein (DUF488 family)
MELFTFGHGTASQQEITDLLHNAGIEAVLDIRTAPGSRHNPHVGRAELERWLPEAGIGYRWEKRLGGFRKAQPDSPDTVWRHPAFRGFAGYTREPVFLEAIDELLEQAQRQRTTVMCSEAVWWRCHRRIVADFVVMARQQEVCHLMHAGRSSKHRPTEGARLTEEGLLIYDSG